MTTEQVLELIRDGVAQKGTIGAWARAHDISPAYVSDVLKGNREPGQKVLAALGLERIVSYEPAGSTT